MYCRIQNLHECDIKIQLASLRMEGEGSNPPHREVTSDDKKDEEKSSKGSGGNTPPIDISNCSIFLHLSRHYTLEAQI